MNKMIRLRILPFIFSAFLIIPLLNVNNSAHAQFSGAADILRSGADDANLLLNEYMKPFGSGFGADLNSGWINSARPYRTFGFDIRVSAAVSIVPAGERSFFIDDLNFQNIERVGGPDESQTAFGDDISGSLVGVFAINPEGTREEITRFTMPQGSGYPYVPAPMIQATVGLVKDTDISFRYSPPIEIDDFSVNLFGIGARHGLNQWIPGGNLFPVDLSVQAGFTRLNSDFGFDLQPETGNDIYNPYNDTDSPLYNPSQWDGQKIDFVANGFTGNLIVGKNLPILSLYGGVGFQTSSVTIKSPGSYPVTDFNPDYDAGSNEDNTRRKIVERLDDPIDLSFSGANSMHAFAGFRIRLAILTISASYTLSNYPTLNAGVGLSFR